MQLTEEHKAKLAEGRRLRKERIELERAQRAMEPAVMAAPFEETDEFKRAVAEAVEAAFESNTAKIAARVAQLRGSANNDDASFARVLAAEISQLVDRDRRGPARVPAKDMELRRSARQKMEQLISEAYVKGLDPEYEVYRACYFDEQLIDPTWVDSQHVLRRTRISWGMVPNEALVPVNDIAKAIHEQFIASIGGATAPINRPDFGRKSLKVHHRDGLDDGPPVGKGQPTGALKILGRDNGPGEVRMTNVLGTIAAPARQLA